MASPPQGGPMAIAMRLRNQLQAVYKMDPLRNEASGGGGTGGGRAAVPGRAGGACVGGRGRRRSEGRWGRAGAVRTQAPGPPTGGEGAGPGAGGRGQV